MPRRSLSAQDDIAVYTSISNCHDSRAKGYSIYKAKNAMETLLPEPILGGQFLCYLEHLTLS
jgi:hypothetical protein